MGGKGNAQEIIAVLERMIPSAPWNSCFKDFPFPYGFYSPEEYRPWLLQVGLEAKRIELVPKDMKHEAKRDLKDGFAPLGYLTLKEFLRS